MHNDSLLGGDGEFAYPAFVDFLRLYNLESGILHGVRGVDVAHQALNPGTGLGTPLDFKTVAGLLDRGQVYALGQGAHDLIE